MHRHDPFSHLGEPFDLAQLPIQKPQHSPMRRDLRGVILGVQDAAQLVGYCRAQMWRDARDGKVRCIVEGTAQRPVYRFLRDDLLEFKQRREVQKQLDQERSQRRTRRKRLSRQQQELLREALLLVGPGRRSKRLQ